MRIPLIRSSGDEAPIAWWEWLCLPVVIPAVSLAGIAFSLHLGVYFIVYPEHQAFIEEYGTNRQQKRMQRWRQRAAAVPIARRLLRIFTLYWLRRGLIRQFRDNRKAARRRRDEPPAPPNPPR